MSTDSSLTHRRTTSRSSTYYSSFSAQPYIVFRALEPLLGSRKDSSSHRLPGPRLSSPIARQRQISRLWTNINLYRKKNPFAPLGRGLFKLSLAFFYWRARF